MSFEDEKFEDFIGKDALVEIEKAGVVFAFVRLTPTDWQTIKIVKKDLLKLVKGMLVEHPHMVFSFMKYDNQLYIG